MFEIEGERDPTLHIAAGTERDALITYIQDMGHTHITHTRHTHITHTCHTYALITYIQDISRQQTHTHHSHTSHTRLDHGVPCLLLHP